MTKQQIKWECKAFADLSPIELYAILHLRMEVFVIEQNCIFQDNDYKDPKCHHLMAWDGNLLVAYARMVPKGVSYADHPSIGRVVNKQSHRQLGLGKELMQHSIKQCENLFGKGSIKIGAQLYLKRFYESFGFIQTSDIYLEDAIDHIEMIRPLQA